jgi:hypothetical protein
MTPGTEGSSSKRFFSEDVSLDAEEASKFLSSLFFAEVAAVIS